MLSEDSLNLYRSNCPAKDPVKHMIKFIENLSENEVVVCFPSSVIINDAFSNSSSITITNLPSVENL